jgi:hypothetical protein
MSAASSALHPPIWKSCKERKNTGLKTTQTKTTTTTVFSIPVGSRAM